MSSFILALHLRTSQGKQNNPKMGNKIVTFTEQQLEDYQVAGNIKSTRFLSRQYLTQTPFHNFNEDCTFFTRKEILRVHKRFREVNPEIVPKRMTEDQAVKIYVPVEDIEKMPELKENPFRRRICEVFSRDGKGNLTFEEFLDLMSMFSEQAPRDIKVFYAFKIYDFDGDKFISTSDLGVALRLLTRSELTADELHQIAEKVVEEADVDGDGKLSYMEFEHVITRAPEFLSTFHMRI